MTRFFAPAASLLLAAGTVREQSKDNALRAFLSSGTKPDRATPLVQIHGTMVPS